MCDYYPPSKKMSTRDIVMSIELRLCVSYVFASVIRGHKTQLFTF